MSVTIGSRRHPWVAEGAQRVRFGIETSVLPDWGATRDFAQTVEGLGFDSLWIPDHPTILGNATWTSLTAIALATQTIRLGPLVACASYWNPVVLARAAADIDRFSNGRFVLGMGSGDIPPEFAQMGHDWQPASRRHAILEESLRIVGPLLRGETVTYHGEYVRAHDVALDPPPVQQPYVPILVAGGGERTTLRCVAEYADASSLGAVSWAGGAYTAEDTQRKFAVLRRHCEELDRPYDAVLRTGLLSVFLSDSPTTLEAKVASLPPFVLPFFERIPVIGTPEDAVPRAQALLDAGFQYIIFVVMGFDLESLQLLAERVLPALTMARSAAAAMHDG